MEVNKKDFQEFLEKISYDRRMTEAIIDFNEEEIKSRVLSKDSQLWICTKLNKGVFKNYKAIGKIGVKDIAYIKDVSKRFSKIVKINLKKNIMSLKEESKEFITTVADPDFIAEAPENLKLEYGEPIIIDVKELNDINADIKLFPDDSNLIIDISNGEIKFVIESKQDKLIRGIKCDSKETKRVAFQVANFKSMVNTLSGEKVKMYIMSDAPMKIEEATGLIYSELVVAPVMEGEVTQKEVEEEE